MIVIGSSGFQNKSTYRHWSVGQHCALGIDMGSLMDEIGRIKGRIRHIIRILNTLTPSIPHQSSRFSPSIGSKRLPYSQNHDDAFSQTPHDSWGLALVTHIFRRQLQTGSWPLWPWCPANRSLVLTFSILTQAPEIWWIVVKQAATPTRWIVVGSVPANATLMRREIICSTARADILVPVSMWSTKVAKFPATLAWRMKAIFADDNRLWERLCFQEMSSQGWVLDLSDATPTVEVAWTVIFWYIGPPFGWRLKNCEYLLFIEPVVSVRGKADLNKIIKNKNKQLNPKAADNS